MKKNLVLLGMMGVGKTSVGKIVAQKQNLNFIDTDTNIERKSIMTISEIFNKKGEKYFRTLEELEVLKSLKKKDCVIALGGGAFLNKIIRGEVLKNTISIWLDLDLKTLTKRLMRNKKRPLLNKENKESEINKLFSERKNIYKLAKHRINCKNKNKKNIVNKIITLYEKQ